MMKNSKQWLSPRCRWQVVIVLLVAVMMCPVLAHAADAVASVAAIAGRVTALAADGSERQLRRGSAVYTGDTIVTAANARVRLLFSDQGRVFVRPSSRFVIAAYHYSGDKQQDESRFSLVKGGFRAITGAIGAANHERVKIATPVATIGIRGTDHEARYCAGDCRDISGSDGQPPADGLYTGTNAGRTLIGGMEFGPGQYGFTSEHGITAHLAQPPAILVRDVELRQAMGRLRAQATKPAQKAAPAQRNKKRPSGAATGSAAASSPDGGHKGEGVFIPAQPVRTVPVRCI